VKSIKDARLMGLKWSRKVN